MGVGEVSQHHGHSRESTPDPHLSSQHIQGLPVSGPPIPTVLRLHCPALSPRTLNPNPAHLSLSPHGRKQSSRGAEQVLLVTSHPDSARAPPCYVPKCRTAPVKCQGGSDGGGGSVDLSCSPPHGSCLRHLRHVTPSVLHTYCVPCLVVAIKLRSSMAQAVESRG